jgi:16S rRNA G1207 methylase RsmC
MKTKDLVYDSVEVGKLGGRIWIVGAASMESKDLLSKLFLYVRVLAQLDECPLPTEISLSS